jgi:hypothetical protein
VVGLGPDDVWGSTTVAVVNPLDHGAIVDDAVDDTGALVASVGALPAAGGIVLFPTCLLRKHEQLWWIQKSHVLLWSPNRRTTLEATVQPRTDGSCGTRQQATIFQETVGGGVYGLRFTSNANQRMSCAEDAQIVLDGVDGTEVVGVEVNNAATNSVFIWRTAQSAHESRNVFLEGNYFHHTWADSVHHTAGTRRSSCWRNFIFNEEPSSGDDGIACVTYSVTGARCGEMEWWDNVYLGGAHGRGLAVVGGEDILIHHNWIIGSSAAGLIVASESSYTTPASERIRLWSNWLVDSPDGTVQNGHSAILVSGGNQAAGPLRDIEAVDNVVIDPAGGRVVRVEGSYENVRLENVTDRDLLPGPQPTLADVEIQDTAILRTRDTSFVEASARAGLYRIHFRTADGGALEARHEYVVSGSEPAMGEWLVDVADAGAFVSDRRAVGGITHALVLSATPLELPPGLVGVSFEDLRAGARAGDLTWLWDRVDRGRYEH